MRTRPLEALIIGGWVRVLSDRDIESLVREGGLGQISKSTVSQITQELRARYKAFRAHALGEVELLVLFCDAIYLPTRPSGAKEGCGVQKVGARITPPAASDRGRRDLIAQLAQLALDAAKAPAPVLAG